MGKLVMGISAAITAFVLALTAGAVYAYRIKPAQPVVSQRQQLSAAQAGKPLEMASAPLAAPQGTQQAGNLSPQDAAALAAKAINRTDLYSVEMSDWQGVQAYKVTFSSGDVVYVDLHGTVLATVPPPPPTVITLNGSNNGDHRSHDGGGLSGGGEGEHDGGDD